MLGSVLGSNLDILYLLAATNAREEDARPQGSARAAHHRAQPNGPHSAPYMVAVCAIAGNITSLGYPRSAALSRQEK